MHTLDMHVPIFEVDPSKSEQNLAYFDEQVNLQE